MNPKIPFVRKWLDMEFSKKLLYFSWAVTLILTALTIWMSQNARPLEAMLVITPLSWTETGASTCYYYWKSKNENRAKYAQRFLKEIAKDWGPETAVRIAEIVLKD